MFKNSRKQHITEAELKSLLYGDSTDLKTEETADHLESCLQCRQALESMAAGPDLWNKASELRAEPSVSQLARYEYRDLTEPTKHDLATDQSVQQVLDAPSHPDWMGSIDSYDVEYEIGRGGMGVVFRAYDRELNRPLAIKVLAPWLAQNGAARKRFAREARAAAAVIHPNVVAIYGVNSSEKTPYIVMPFVAGPSLQHLIDERGALDEKDIVRIALQVSGGLGAAHAQGLVHRDIKPANILVEADVSRVLVTDFGLARAVDDASATQSGYFVGTPNYMSPEQALGGRVDARSDLFSLGSVLYFMATGRMPFRADSPISVLNRISHDQPTGVRQVNSDISETLTRIIDKLHEKNPEDRFQSAGELHSVLEKYLAYLHQPDISKPPIIPASTSKAAEALTTAKGRNSKAIVATLFAVVAIASLAFAAGSGWISIPGWASFAASDPQGDVSNEESPDHQAKNPEKSEPALASGSGSGGSGSGSGSGKSEEQPMLWPEIVSDKGIPGKLVTVKKKFYGKIVDGYSLYLPRSFSKKTVHYPVLLCLQGGSSVGGDVSRVNHWGVPLHLQQDHPKGSKLDRYLRDSFIIVSPHIKKGEFFKHPTAIREIIDEMVAQYRADDSRVYLTGLSRGGSGTWGLVSRIPGVFAAAAPVAGKVDGIKDYSILAETPLWVVHNEADDVVSFQPVAEVVSKLTKMDGQTFHRADSVNTVKPNDLQHSRILTSPNLKDHDAWNAFYGDPVFYEWLLLQKLKK